MMNKPKINVQVVSDVVCPWCYIGKRRLEKAMHNLSDKFEFEVEYLPYELNPQMPVNGRDQKEYLTQKFGGEARYSQITGQVTNVAAQEGLVFDFVKQKTSPNTRNAHRLIQFAKAHGKQLSLVEALFKAYFTEGLNLSDNENLVNIASWAGLDANEVRSYLQSTDGAVEIEMTEKQLQQVGISGVPFYIIDNKYGVSGAQPSEEFIKAFEQIGTALSPTGEACDVEGKDC